MVSNKIAKLIQNEIDGTGTARTGAQLQEILGRDPEARALYEDLRNLSRMLSEVPSVEPPRTLRPSVMRTLDTPEPARRRGRWEFSVLRSVRMRGMLRPASVFPVGVLAGMILIVVYINVINRPAVQPKDAAATLLLQPVATDLTDSRTTAIGIGNDAVTVTTGKKDGLSVLSIRLSARAAMTLNVGFDDRQIEIQAVRRSEGTGSTLTMAPGRVTIVSGNDAEFTFFIRGPRNQAQNIHLRLSEPGGAPQERVIELAEND